MKFVLLMFIILAYCQEAVLGKYSIVNESCSEPRLKEMRMYLDNSTEAYWCLEYYCMANRPFDWSILACGYRVCNYGLCPQGTELVETDQTLPYPDCCACPKCIPKADSKRIHKYGKRY